MREESRLAGLRTLPPRLMAAGLYFSGLVALARGLARLSGPRLIILTYHRASERQLRHQLGYLQRHYRIVPLDEALSDLYAPAMQKSADRDRRTPLALTFDDGYQDSCLCAARLAHELGLPFTVFLIPGYVDSGERFWWHETIRIVQAAGGNQVTVSGQTYRLDRKGRRALARDLHDAATHSRSVAERETLLAHARDAMHVASDPPGEDRQGCSLTWSEIDEMRSTGWVHFGAHTVHHPVLGHLRERAEVEREVGACRRLLEDRLGQQVRCFAYPLGRMEHIGDPGLDVVRNAGYDWAVTTIRGSNTPKTDPHLLRRIGVGAEQHWLVLAADVAGLWPFPGLRALSHAMRQLKRQGPVAIVGRGLAARVFKCP